ncbi:MAG: DUF4214 domain-containing protein [Pirellulales bacterium]|nr:DUF4214 domain-containing protein [Pirellulales bacterium]
MFAQIRRHLAGWHKSSRTLCNSPAPRRGRHLSLERLEARQVLATLTPVPAVTNPNIVVPSQDQLTRDQHGAQIAMSPDGNSTVAVWQHETNTAGTATEIHFQRFDLSGAPLFAEQKIAGSASRSDDQDARISIADNGTFVIAWEATVGVGGQQNVFFQKFGANGAPLTAIQAVPSAGGTNSNPDVIQYPNGLEAVVVWQRSDSPNNSSIHMLHFEFDSPTTTNAPRLRPEKIVSAGWEAVGVTLNTDPRVVGPTNFPGGIITFAWVGYDTPTHSDILMRRYDSLDADEFDTSLVPQFGGYPRFSESRSAPSMSVDASGNLYIAFAETVTIPGQPLDHDLYLARLRLDTWPVSANFVTPIDADGTSGLGSARHDVVKSSISATAAGESAVTWQIENSRQGIPTNGSTYLEARLFGIDGLPNSPIVSPVDSSNVQSSGPGKQLDPQVAVSPDGQRMVVGWTSDVNRRTNAPADNAARSPGDQDLVLQVFSASGVVPPPPPPPPPPPLPPAPPVSPAGPVDSRVIASTYQLALRRSADDPGLAYWGYQLAGMNREQVVLELLKSTEFRTRAINDAYQQLLNRAADDAGRRYWLRQLEAGQSLQHVIAGILGSEEYRALAGGTNFGFISAVYQDILGRAPDTLGRFFWNDQLTPHVDRATGVIPAAMDRTGVALAILTSEEASIGQVNDLYASLLRRSADPAGRAYWSARLRSGAHFEEVIAAFLGSAEYWTQFQLYVTQNALTGTANSDARSFLLGTGRNTWNWLRSLL